MLSAVETEYAPADPFDRSDVGALMKYADELADRRVIPLGAAALLQRMCFRYRPKNGNTACVPLVELAGDGLSKTTVVRYIKALESAHLIFKTKWGSAKSGKWVQFNNRYRFIRADAAKAMALCVQREQEEQVWDHLFTVSLPPEPSESTFWPILESARSETLPGFDPSLYARKDEDAHGKERTSGDDSLARPDAGGTEAAAGNSGRDDQAAGCVQAAPEAEPMGTDLCRQHGGLAGQDARNEAAVSEAVGQNLPDSGQGVADAGGHSSRNTCGNGNGGCGCAGGGDDRVDVVRPASGVGGRNSERNDARNPNCSGDGRNRERVATTAATHEPGRSGDGKGFGAWTAGISMSDLPDKHGQTPRMPQVKKRDPLGNLPTLPEDLIKVAADREARLAARFRTGEQQRAERDNRECKSRPVLPEYAALNASYAKRHEKVLANLRRPKLQRN